MADDPAYWLQQLREHAGGSHLRDWQIFPQLAERLKQGEIADAAALADLVLIVATAHPDIHLRRWALAFLALVAEYQPEQADAVLATLLAVLAGEWPWAAPAHPALWDAAVAGLTDLATRLPAVVLPHRRRILGLVADSARPPAGLPVPRILEGLRQGMLRSLRHRTIRSTPKLLDEATDEARFAIWEKDRYHTATCRHLLRHVGVRLVPLAAMAEAAEYGFHPCSSCHKVGKDGSVTAKAFKPETKKETVPELPAPPQLTMGRFPRAEDPWQPPEPRPDLDLAHVPPPSAYGRLTLLSPDQQRLIGMWVKGELGQLSDVYRVIYARHYATMLGGPHGDVAAEALERSATGIAKDAWCAAQLVMAAAVAAYRQQEKARYARILAQRPETVFDYPFLIHLHADLGAVMTPELLFAMRKLSGTRSSAMITKRWDEFVRRCQERIDQFVAEHDGDPIQVALKVGKGRNRVLAFTFGREFAGEVRCLDFLHGHPLARATGDVLQSVMTALKPVTQRANKAQRGVEERAELEALHRAPDAAQAVQSLIAGLSVGPGASRIVAEQGMKAFETGEMVKATAYLAKALAVSPEMAGAVLFRRALDRAAGSLGIAVGGLL
jgi:hypothetical protein